MSEVYFSKEIDKILDNVDWNSLGENVAIKVHFGEKGCTTYLSPEIVKKVYDMVVSLGKKATLVECNVLYKGSRTNSKDHIKTAKENGFTFAPIDILDGELGDEYIEIEVGGISKKAKIGAGIKKYDSMIVLSHFKGHMMAGFGGAIKNIGMGLGSRRGKLHMHSGLKPWVNKDKCTGCRVCYNHCDYNSIKMIDGKANIIPETCVGCAMCIAVCPTGAVNVPWGGSKPDEVIKKFTEYSKGVLEIIPKTLFINFLINITKDCDCMSISQKPIIPDIGILYSKDIVSIDKASYDLICKDYKSEFDKINNIDKNIQVDYASSIGLGKKEYKLFEL
ncbi:MAG: DUF362 domain-containing protein [Candidatus Pacearchaeota archaeon]|jgi:hypothetical protein